jgi:hypothetical protein
VDRPDVARRAIEAYGGEARWRAARSLSVTVSAWGWAFRLKWRAPMVRRRARLELHRPAARLDMPDGRRVAVLEGRDVGIEDREGRVVASRGDPRRFFPYGRRALWWDDLDFAYFASYALWNYATLPALLLRDDLAWRPSGPHSLRATFPPEIPTHSAEQEFHFDPATGLLRQHDYTAEVFGSWARAAHVVLAHGRAEVPFASERRALPRRRDGSPAPWPLLVGIHLEDFGLE